MANIGNVEGAITLKDLYSSALSKFQGQVTKAIGPVKLSVADLEKQLQRLAKVPSLRADAVVSAKVLAQTQAQNRAIQESIAAHSKGASAVQALNNQREISARLLTAGIAKESAYGRQIIAEISNQQRLRAELAETAAQHKINNKNLQQLTNTWDRFKTRVLFAITAIAAALPVIAVKASTSFEDSFAGIRKTVNATEGQFDELADGMRRMSKEIPTSVNELNKVGESAGQLGIRTENILSFTRVVADLGETTDLAGDEAASALARIANITGLSQDKFDRLGSTIVALGNNFATVESKIVDFTLRIAGSGKIAGLTEPQIAAIGAAMASVGVEAEAGGTSVQKVLLGISKAVSQGNKDLAVYAKTAGLSASQFKQAWQEDAGRAFTKFIEGLGRQGLSGISTLESLKLTDQRLIRSFLSLAGAGDLLSRAMEIGNTAFKENTALSEEARKRYETLSSQIKITRNILNDLFIITGEQMSPALVGLSHDLAKLAESADFKQFAKDLGQELAKAIRILADTFKFLVENIDLVKSILTVIIGLKILAWAQALRAAFITASEGATIFGASLGPISLAIIAGIALYNALKSKLEEISRSYEDATQRIVESSKKVGDAWNTMRGIVKSGVITPEQFAEANKGWVDATEKLKAYKKELEDLPKTEFRISYREKRQKELNDLIKQQELLQKSYAKTIEGAKVVAGAQDDLGDSTGDLKKPTDDLGDSLGKISKKWAQSVKDISTNIVKQKFLAEASEKSQEAFARAQVTIRLWEAGLKSSLGPLSAQGRALIEVERKTILYENRVKLATNAIEAEKDAIQRLNDVLDEQANKPFRTGVDKLLDPKNATEYEAAWEDTFGDINRMVDDAGDHSKAVWTQLAADMAVTLTDSSQRLASGISQSFTSALTQVLATGKLDFEQFWHSIADLGASIIADQITSAITKALSGAKGAWADFVKFASSNTGMIAAGIGTISNIANANNKGYAVAGAAAGAAIGAAIAGYFSGGMGAGAGAMWGAFIGSAIGGMIKKGQPKFHAALTAALGQVNLQGSLARQAPGIADEIQQGIDKIVSSLGGTFNSLAAGITFETRKGMNVIVDGIGHYFKEGEWQQGIQFAIVEALKRADISGISNEAKSVLQHTMADTLDELASDLDFARFIENLGLDEAAVNLKDAIDTFAINWNRMVELGIDGSDRLKASLVSTIQAQRNDILGIQETAKERLLRQKEAFNAQLLLEEAERQSKIADLKIKEAALRADTSILQAHQDITKQRLLIDGEFVKAQNVMAGAQANALVAIQNAISALEALPDFRQFLISDADVGAALGRLGGGKGRKRQDREALQSILDNFNLSLMSDISRAVADINSRYQENLRLAHNDASLIDQVNKMRAQEINLLRAQLREQVTPYLPSMQLGVDGNMFDTGEWGVRAQEIMNWADQIAQSNAEMLRETGEAALTAEEIATAAANRIHQLIEEAIDSLNLPMEQIRDRVQGLSDTLTFLRQQLDAGAISADRFGDVISQMAAQATNELYGLASSILDTMGNQKVAADFKAKLDQANFILQVTQLNFLYQQYLALGLIADDVAKNLGEVLNWINDPKNWPKFDPKDYMPPPPPPPPVLPQHDNTLDDLTRDIDRAKEAIKDILRSAMNPYKRELLELNEQFAEYRRLLGNTPEVMRAYNIALKQLNDRYTKNLRETLKNLGSSSFTPAQNIAHLQEQFDAIIASGDISQSDELSQIIQQLEQAYGQAYGTAGGGFQEFIARLRAQSMAFLGETSSVGNTMANVLKFPGNNAVSSLANSNPVVARVDESNLILDRIERNTRGTEREVKRSTVESLTTRRIQHRDLRSVVDATKTKSVTVGNRKVSWVA